MVTYQLCGSTATANILEYEICSKFDDTKCETGLVSNFWELPDMQMYDLSLQIPPFTAPMNRHNTIDIIVGTMDALHIQAFSDKFVFGIGVLANPLNKHCKGS